MHRFAEACSLAAIVVAALVAAPSRASTNEEVEQLWERYLNHIGCRNAPDTIGCYSTKIYESFSNDNTAAARARLDVHMADLFSILWRDYEPEVIDETDSGNKVTYTIKHVSKNKNKPDYTEKVEFIQEEGRWCISQPPQPPDFLQPRKGMVPMIAGIVIALVAAVFVGKKLLGG